MLESVWDWALGLGAEYGVNPVVFAAIYIGAIPFFALSIGWLVRRYKSRKSIVLPALSAGFFFVSAYLYLAVVGEGIPAWVYVFMAAMIGFGIVSTIRKVRLRIHEHE